MTVDGYETVVQLVLALAVPGKPTVVGIAGGVSVGKSTTAEALAEMLRAAPPGSRGPVEVVSTDGFLFPNTELIARGILHRKGFPESYDTAAIERFLGGLGRGEPALVPVYSHQTYDIVPGGERRIVGADAVLLEGVNALQLAAGLDLAVYVDASEADMEEWYTLRFLELCVDPPPGSFYSQFAALDEDAVRDLAHAVWRDVNLVNLRECIQPTRVNADVIIEKRSDHSVGRVRVRA